MKTLFRALSLVACVALMGACNTVKGLGHDVSTVGEKSEQLITGKPSTTQPN